ncbi:hypothetical protein [Bradyrhizobium phage BDU-MI-1]|nr:hypothetical protein [Bradyrhizobium phage BDU-MI-1]
MEQSRVMSLVEVATSSLIGFVVAVFINWALLPMFGMHPSFSQSFWFTLIFTAISIVRAYLVRRFFAVYVTRFAAWCQEVYDDLSKLARLT